MERLGLGLAVVDAFQILDKISDNGAQLDSIVTITPYVGHNKPKMALLLNVVGQIDAPMQRLEVLLEVLDRPSFLCDTTERRFSPLHAVTRPGSAQDGHNGQYDGLAHYRRARA